MEFFSTKSLSLLGMIPAQTYWQISYRLPSVTVTIPFLVWPSEVEFLDLYSFHVDGNFLFRYAVRTEITANEQ